MILMTIEVYQFQFVISIQVLKDSMKNNNFLLGKEFLTSTLWSGLNVISYGERNKQVMKPVKL
jgi:hypothetical protein